MQQHGKSCVACTTPEDLLGLKPAYLVEAASPAAMKEFALPALKNGTSIVTLSIGALADTAFYQEVMETAKANGTRVYIVSGATGGFDVLRTRYYAANKDKLPSPFKVIQTDRVFRAERPQKGRLREFVQCDIDILGDESPNAEVELIDVTTRALLGIGFNGFTVNINDRRILRGMLESMGFAADTLDSVCITFDKMDKIGADAVKAELLEKQLPESAVNALADFIAAGEVTLDAVAARCADPAIAEERFPCRFQGRSHGGKCRSLRFRDGRGTGYRPATRYRR